MFTQWFYHKHATIGDKHVLPTELSNAMFNETVKTNYHACNSCHSTQNQMCTTEYSRNNINPSQDDRRTIADETNRLMSQESKDNNIDDDRNQMMTRMLHLPPLQGKHLNSNEE